MAAFTSNAVRLAVLQVIYTDGRLGPAKMSDTAELVVRSE